MCGCVGEWVSGLIDLQNAFDKLFDTTAKMVMNPNLARIGLPGMLVLGGMLQNSKGIQSKMLANDDQLNVLDQMGAVSVLHRCAALHMEAGLIRCMPPADAEFAVRETIAKIRAQLDAEHLSDQERREIVALLVCKCVAVFLTHSM